MNGEWNGLGFLKLPLVRDTRLHIHVPMSRWHGQLVSNARIHDHNWAFEAKVLVGEVHVVDYEVVMSGTGRFGLYDCFNDGHSPTQMRYQGRCNVELVQSALYRAGDIHTSTGPGQFHDVWAYRPTVTAMQKISDPPSGRAPQVVGPVHGSGTAVHDAFGPQFEIDSVDKQRLIDEAMELLGEREW